VEDSQVPRDAGLVNPGPFNEVVDLPLALTQGFDNVAPRGIGEDLKGV
jgi:hypothetical protein